VLFLTAAACFAAPCHADAQTSPPTGSAAVDDATSLLPGDVIRILIWREGELSGDFPVSGDGTVVLPLLGTRPVLGISMDRLRDQLTTDYDEYLVNPSVNVTLLRRITVLGEVRLPGNYLVDATVSVAQLIAQAQGVTPDGDINKLQLLRGGQIVRGDLSSTLLLTEAGIRSGDQVTVGKRGWLSRNLTSMVGLLSIVSNVVSVIIITGS